jgi:hypothetical protein
MCDLKQDFHNVMVACVNECRDNGYEPRYQLEYMFLNFDGVPESQYVSSLIDLLIHSDDESLRHTSVKSIKFGHALSRKSVHDLITRTKINKAYATFTRRRPRTHPSRTPRWRHQTSTRSGLGVDKMKSLQKLDIWGHPCSKDVKMMLGASPDT